MSWLVDTIESDLFVPCTEEAMLSGHVSNKNGSTREKIALHLKQNIRIAGDVFWPAFSVTATAGNVQNTIVDDSHRRDRVGNAVPGFGLYVDVRA